MIPYFLPETTTTDSQCLFETLSRQHRRRLYNHVYRVVQNAADAEDVTQEVFARAWAHFTSYDSNRSFEAWVFRIATNLCIDHSRRQKHRQHVSLEAYATGEAQEAIGEVPDVSHDPALCFMAKQINEGLVDAIQMLSAEYQTTVLLLQKDYNYQQIADAMNCPVGTVRSRVHRARVQMRRILEDPSDAVPQSRKGRSSGSKGTTQQRKKVR